MQFALLKVENKDLYSYALILVCIFSLGLSGCSGLVTANGGNPPPPALTISGVQAAMPTPSGFQVSWSTSAAANSAVDYGKSTSYGSTTPVSSTMVTSHQVAVSGLATGTLYHFRVRSTDAKGNNASSGDMDVLRRPGIPLPRQFQLHLQRPTRRLPVP